MVEVHFPRFGLEGSFWSGTLKKGPVNNSQLHFPCMIRNSKPGRGSHPYIHMNEIYAIVWFEGN